MAENAPWEVAIAFVPEKMQFVVISLYSDRTWFFLRDGPALSQLGRWNTIYAKLCPTDTSPTWVQAFMLFTAKWDMSAIKNGAERLTRELNDR